MKTALLLFARTAPGLLLIHLLFVTPHFLWDRSDWLKLAPVLILTIITGRNFNIYATAIAFALLVVGCYVYFPQLENNHHEALKQLNIYHLAFFIFWISYFSFVEIFKPLFKKVGHDNARTLHR